MRVRLLVPFLALAALLAAVWWLASPLVRDTVVDEPVPSAPSSAPSSAGVPDSMIRALERMTPEEFAAKSSTEQQMMRGILDQVSRSMPDTPMDEAAAGGSVVASGTFRDADGFYKGSGTATVHRLPDGSRVLRFENFRVTNGPALHVLLVADAVRPRDAMIDLGSLKGNVGNQNYAIPAGVDVAEYPTVLIYCVPFSTPFASAELAS